MLPMRPGGQSPGMRAATRSVPSGIRILKAAPRSRGHYLAVALRRDNVLRSVYVHQLVALAFIGPCPPGMEVLHGPGGKLDNRLANLHYGTRSENQLDRRRDGNVSTASAPGEAHGMAKLTWKAVREIRRWHAAGASQAALGREFGVSKSAIGLVVRRETWAEVPS